MGDELNEQAVGAEVAAAEAASAEATSSEATSEDPGAPDIEAQINDAVQAAIKQYEGADGHLARLRSKKDKEIARLQKQLSELQQGKAKEAMDLLEKDPTRAAQLLAGIVEEQSRAAAQADTEQQVIDWQRRIMEKLEFDLDSDEEAAKLAAEWVDKLVDKLDYTWDFQQEVAVLAKEREKKQRVAAQKELAQLKEGLPGLIEAQVTRALVGAGVIPEPSSDGTPPERNENWRENPSVSRGLAKRKKRAIRRT